MNKKTIDNSINYLSKIMTLSGIVIACGVIIRYREELFPGFGNIMALPFSAGITAYTLYLFGELVRERAELLYGRKHNWKSVTYKLGHIIFASWIFICAIGVSKIA